MKLSSSCTSYFSLLNILKTSQLPLNKTSFWRSENNYFLWVLRKSCQKQPHIVVETFLTYFTVWSNHFGWMLQNWSNKSATSSSYLDDTAQWTQEHSPAFILNHAGSVWSAPMQQRWGLERLSHKQSFSFLVFKRYLFIWLYQVLIPTRGICIASFRIFHCSAQTLVVVYGLSSCGLHGLSCSTACRILDMGSFSPGMEPGSPELQGGFLTPGQPGNSL